MIKNQDNNDIYAALIDSIGELYSVTESVKKDKSALDSFSDYLTQNETEISKFENATNELCGFMNGYDFTKGFLLETMLEKTKKLHPLRLKLGQMGEEAKKIKVYPDRYGSQRAIEICRNLAIKCKEKLGLDETEKVSQIIDANINKLIEIQKEFQGDGYILLQINEMLDSNKALLVKYKAYYGEIQQYVSNFPHSDRKDLEIVNDRIETAKQVDVLIGSVQKHISLIQNYYDRYGKKNVVTKYRNTNDDIYVRMHYLDVNGYKTRLNEIIKQANAVSNEFEREYQDIVSILATLNQNKPDIWKEENEELKRKLTQLIDKDTRLVQLDLVKIKDTISAARRKRTSDIKETTEKYSWLVRNSYASFHKNLVSRYISYSEYKSAIAEARAERIKKILKIVGKVLLYTIGIPLLIIYFIFNVIFGSDDD